MAQTDRAPARLAAHRECLDQQLIEIVTFPRLLTKRIRACAEGLVVKLLQLGLEGVDSFGHRKVPFDLSLVRIEQLAENDHVTSVLSRRSAAYSRHRRPEPRRRRAREGAHPVD